MLAHAVKRPYPNAKLAIGPAIDNGFYYDFDVDTPFTIDDLAKLETEMVKIAKEDIPLERLSVSSDEAKALMEKNGEIYKLELIEEHAGKGENISLYHQALYWYFNRTFLRARSRSGLLLFK